MTTATWPANRARMSAGNSTLPTAILSRQVAVIREALRKAKRVALGQMAVRGRDYIVAIKPCGDGLLLETLRYADEIRESDQVFDHIPEAKLEGIFERFEHLHVEVVGRLVEHQQVVIFLRQP
mgnify:CR=1 FL=1